MFAAKKKRRHFNANHGVTGRLYPAFTLQTAWLVVLAALAWLVDRLAIGRLLARGI